MSIDFTGVTMPFNVGDLLNTSMGLLNLNGGFILLGIGFVVVVRIIDFIYIANFAENEDDSLWKRSKRELGRAYISKR